MNLRIFSVVGVLALAGCVTAPVGPTHVAFPGRDKSFEQFQLDDAACRDFANVQSGGRPSADRANEAAVGSAVLGTAIGAAAGALIGGNAAGAGIGAGFGLITGSAIGSGTAAGTYYSTQRVYDGAYHQCMYAKGNRVPVFGRYVQAAQPVQRQSYAPPPASLPPPPANGPTNIANPPLESIPPPDAPPPPR